jgi:hypothetical protein
MAFSTHSTSASSAPLSDKPRRLPLNWGGIVTVVAASIAVLIVATIAVLMGMA